MGTKTKAYLIEFNKLVMGLNEFEFMLDEELLAEFEFAPLSHAKVKVDLKLYKTDSMYDFRFVFKGHARVDCDTCAENIDLPLNEKFNLMMKLSEANNFDDTEIIYIARTEIEFDLKQYLYESLLLSIPQKKNCEVLPEPKPCNQDVLNKLGQIEIEEKDDTKEEESIQKADPRWDKLKDLLN